MALGAISGNGMAYEMEEGQEGGGRGMCGLRNRQRRRKDVDIMILKSINLLMYFFSPSQVSGRDGTCVQ